MDIQQFYDNPLKISNYSHTPSLYVKIEIMAINIVFMGSSDFSGIVLKSLADSYKISGVVTQPDKPAGRGKVLTPPPAKEVAESLNIPVFQPAKLRTP